MGILRFMIHALIMFPDLVITKLNTAQDGVPLHMPHPDYFNACCPFIGLVGVPQNAGGYQNARSGVGYCGFLTYDSGLPNQGYWCEYIQTQLSEPLEAGKRYKCSFFINCAKEYHLASSSIGAYFSEVKITTNTYIPINVIPQICSNFGFISDTVNWIEISATFLAKGGEKYITIGHFGDTLYPDTLRWRFDLPPGFSPSAFYYVDDVSVELCDECINNTVYVPNIFSPNSDGFNDILYVRGNNIDALDFSVYDRWGEKTFTTKDISIGWDGTYRGNICDNGVYAYFIKILFLDGTTQTNKGNITIMR